MYNYDTNMIGFGGKFNEKPPAPKPIDNGDESGGMGAGMVILIIAIVLVLCGLGYYGFRKYQEKQLVNRLVEIDQGNPSQQQPLNGGQQRY